MIGAIIGDIIGSRFERQGNFKSKEFTLFKDKSKFTDDTVLTIAVADCILNNLPFAKTIRAYGLQYPGVGYGARFKMWLTGMMGPYNSWGNGSAMRVSPIGFAYDTEEEILQKAKESAEVTHNHPEGIKGAQAIALAIFWARSGQSKRAIRVGIEEKFGYDLSRTIAEIRPEYKFDVSCQGSVPESIIAFLESTDYEDTIRNAISIGGDTDTIACMAGGIAQAFYGGVPRWISEEGFARLDAKMIKIVNAFERQYFTRKGQNKKLLRVGVVGFSKSQFDKKMAILKLRNKFEDLLDENDSKNLEIVSGYTNMGVPRIAYLLADDLGIKTVGFSAKQALKVKRGVYPVQKEIIVGERFGDESMEFIKYIDILIRIGGGQQSRHEVELFKKHHKGKDLSKILYEEEIDWYGKS